MPVPPARSACFLQWHRPSKWKRKALQLKKRGLVTIELMSNYILNFRELCLCTILFSTLRENIWSLLQRHQKCPNRYCDAMHGKVQVAMLFHCDIRVFQTMYFVYLEDVVLPWGFGFTLSWQPVGKAPQSRIFMKMHSRAHGNRPISIRIQASHMQWRREQAREITRSPQKSQRPWPRC